MAREIYCTCSIFKRYWICNGSAFDSSSLLLEDSLRVQQHFNSRKSLGTEKFPKSN